MKKSLCVLGIICAIIFGSNYRAFAISVLVDYTYTGSPGNYLLDFTVTNNIHPTYSQEVYFWGVNLPNDPSQVSPANWHDWGGSWSGTYATYTTTWISNGASGWIYSGNSQSGFTINTSSVPDTIRYYAYSAYGSEYNGDDAVLKGRNPRFEGIANYSGDVVPEPASIILLSIGLLGTGFIRRRESKV